MDELTAAVRGICFSFFLPAARVTGMMAGNIKTR